MQIFCSYCRASMGEVEPREDTRASHGICSSCAEHFQKTWSVATLDEYLDTYEFPVIAVDAEERIVGINALMTKRCGRVRPATIGYLCGDVLECTSARLEEGCGRTIHCPACAVRRALMAALETGEVHEERGIFQARGGQRHLRIEAHPEKGFVRLEFREYEFVEDAAVKGS